MAKKENPKDKKTSRRNPPESGERGSPRSKKRALAAVVVAIVLVGIIITAFVFSLNRVPIGSATSGSFQSFISGLNTSNTVRIFVSDPNSTVYVNTTYCGTSFIYQIEKAHNIHKAPSSIDFFVLSLTIAAHMLSVFRTPLTTQQPLPQNASPYLRRAQASS